VRGVRHLRPSVRVLQVNGRITSRPAEHRAPGRPTRECGIATESIAIVGRDSLAKELSALAPPDALAIIRIQR